MSAEPAPAGSDIFARWTIRGLAAIGLLGCLAFVAIIAIIMIFEMEGPRRPPATVEGAGTHEVFTVENINPVPHTDLISMEVHPADERADGSGYSVRGSSSDRRNIVLLNTVTGTSRRILPDNRRHVDEYGFLPGDHGNRDEATGGEAKAKAAVTSYYLVIDQPGETHLADLMLGRSRAKDRRSSSPGSTASTRSGCRTRGMSRSSCATSTGFFIGLST